MRTVFAAVIAVLAVAGIGTVLVSRSGPPTASPLPVASSAHAQSPAPARVIATVQAAKPTSAPLPPLPQSLQGTAPDGALRVDAHGNLVVDAELRHFFDYYLAATGEESDAVIRERIRAQLHAQLPPKAALQGETLLDHYLAYRDAGRTLEALPDDASLADRLAAVKALREKFLGPEAEQGLFGDEESLDRVALERQKLEADPSLTPEQREAREQALESELPDRIRRERAASIAPVQLARDEAEMRREGATDEDIRQYRIQTSGPEAADRLAALDAQRSDFQNRVAQFQAKLREIEQEPLSAEARQAEIDRELDQRFAANERLHAQVLSGLVRIP